MKPLKVLSMLGTRPEAIKFAPVLMELEQRIGVTSLVGVTGQHREMLQQMLSQFSIIPDFNLDVMTASQTLHHLSAAILTQMHDVLNEHKPDRVLVQGDTATGFIASLACFYSGVPVGHIEAGLRSHDMYAPFPEEWNRRAISLMADMHFTPTCKATGNLLYENVPQDHIIQTGNTVVDALYYMSDMLEANNAAFAQYDVYDPAKKLLLVTMHRRENLNGGIERICEALLALASRSDVHIIVPVHLNPKVGHVVHDMLSDHPCVTLTEPLDYLHFIYLMNKAYMIISDSGGVQEEGPALQTPVLVTRTTTERPEGVDANAVALVGTDTKIIFDTATILLDDELEYKAMQQARNLYGDGGASKRIVDAIVNHHMESRDVA